VGGLRQHALRLVGVEPAVQPLGMLDIATAQWRLDRLGRLDRVDLRLEPGVDPLAVQDAIRALLPPGVRLTTPGEASDDAVRLSRAYRSNLTALALVALFTGAFLVYATQSLAVARRRRDEPRLTSRTSRRPQGRARLARYCRTLPPHRCETRGGPHA
jgi:putative ABC transport system permease protein